MRVTYRQVQDDTRLTYGIWIGDPAMLAGTVRYDDERQKWIALLRAENGHQASPRHITSSRTSAARWLLLAGKIAVERPSAAVG